MFDRLTILANHLKRGTKQAATVVTNIQHLLNKEPAEAYINLDNPGIHLTLGIVSCNMHLCFGSFFGLTVID